MDRRQFCKALTAGIVGGTALSAATGTVSAHNHYGAISTRGHFEVSWGEVSLTDGNDEYNWETEGTVPGIDTSWSPGELVVFVHGFKNKDGKEDDDELFGEAAAALSANGYDEPLVGFTWDSDQTVLEWWSATEIARRNGKKLASALDQFKRHNPHTPVRVITYSLGAQVALACLAELDRWDWGHRIDSVSLLGAAVGDDAPHEYWNGIANRAWAVDNFHSDRDDVLRYAYGAAEWETALGLYGSGVSTPWNYADHAVNYVPNHFTYYETDGGCMHEVVGSW